MSSPAFVTCLQYHIPRTQQNQAFPVTQQLLNDYAKEHERQTTLDFHHQLKGAILDAVDEGMIDRDPTRKAITPADFDFSRQTLSISKTWDYKGKGGFLPTKNKSSIRKIQIDWQNVVKFSELTKNLPENEPIFAGNKKIYNSTVNDILTRHCRRCGISEISIHGLRHTHASLLLFAGVSIASVAQIRTCQYDYNTENISSYYSGTGK